jgi:hypothetical protein
MTQGSEEANRMAELPFDLEDPPEEPPAGAVQPMLWRLAVLLHRDHDRPLADPGEPRRCRACGDPWPCRHRRLAERALVAACDEPQVGRGPGSFTDWYLSAEHEGPKRS